MTTLTAAQQELLEHDDGPVRLSGRAGTGKTTALRHRYVRLARLAGAPPVLVFCRDRGASRRFREAVLPQLAGGFESLTVTTFRGLAFGVVARHVRPPRVLRASEASSLIRRLLREESGDRRLWPTLHELVGRRAFADEVARVLAAWQGAAAGTGEVLATAQAAGVGTRWAELASFLTRYRAALRRLGAVDGAGLVAEAARLLEQEGGSAGDPTAPGKVVEVMVDDVETAGLAAHRLLTRLLGADDLTVVLAGNPEAAVAGAVGVSEASLDQLAAAVGAHRHVRLDDVHRGCGPPRLVHCTHPSVEPEAVAGELLAARGSGLPWSSMAVLVRAPATRGGGVVRALTRHGIPTTARVGPPVDDPTAAGLFDLLRWAAGERAALDRLLVSPLSPLEPGEVRDLRRRAAATGAPLERHLELARLVAIRDDLREHARTRDIAALAHRAFRLALGHLVRPPGVGDDPADARALDAVVGLVDRLNRFVDHHPGLLLPGALALLDEGVLGEEGRGPRDGDGADAVTVTSIGAARGREWDLVVLAGCVEGELPRLRSGAPFFDQRILGGLPLPDVPERRWRALAAERAWFDTARSRARRVVVATAAPETGVLVSRFVDGWPRQAPRLPLVADPPPPVPAPTPKATATCPDSSLHLSATQLATYEDCPLRYGLTYVLGARGESGLHAELGTLVHEVLRRFVDLPDPDRTLERLHLLAEECWRDDIAPYRPQLEEARRDYYDMLDLWFEREGSQLGRALEVLAAERRFDVPVGRHRLSGAIDRVDRADDGGVRVVDYKTGKARPPKPDEVATNLQLAVYHLAAARDPEIAAWGPPTQLRLLYLRSMTAVDQPVTADHGVRTEERILAVAQRILADDFEPSVHADCDHCDFHRLCPLWPEGREVGR